MFGRAIDVAVNGYAGDMPGAEKAMAGYFEILAGENTKADSIMFIGQTLLVARRDGLNAGVEQAVAAGDEAIDNRDAQQWASTLFHQAARFGQPSAVAKSLRRIADRIGGGVAPIAAAHAEALRDSDEDGLQRVSRGFLELGYRPYAAEVLNAAAGMVEEHNPHAVLTVFFCVTARGHHRAGTPRVPSSYSPRLTTSQGSRLVVPAQDVAGFRTQTGAFGIGDMEVTSTEQMETVRMRVDDRIVE